MRLTSSGQIEFLKNETSFQRLVDLVCSPDPLEERFFFGNRHVERITRRIITFSEEERGGMDHSHPGFAPSEEAKRYFPD